MALSAHQRVFYAANAVFWLLVLAALPGSSRAIDLFSSGYSTNFKVESYKERQFRSVVRQKFDFSCGSAAVATLLNYHYDWPVDEREVLLSMYAKGDKEKIRKEGFSLLDMKNYLSGIGFKANGYRASLDKLVDVGVPALALINQAGYLHFVVIKGVMGEQLLIGDPAVGLRTYKRKEFEDMWNGILFVVLNQKQLAQQTFNRAQDWKTKEKAQFDSALSDRALAGFTVHTTPTPGYFY